MILKNADKITSFQYGYLSTTKGFIEIKCDHEAIVQIIFADEPSQIESDQALMRDTKTQIQEYLLGNRTHFSLPIKNEGTEFQQKVWQALCSIPYGETRSYQDIAKQIGSPKAVRAVGTANGKNPLCIIVPCHRVVGKNGQLTGYSGGLSRKQWLLDLETMDKQKQ